MVATDAIGMGLNLYVRHFYYRDRMIEFSFWIGVSNVWFSIVLLNHNWMNKEKRKKIRWQLLKLYKLLVELEGKTIERMLWKLVYRSSIFRFASAFPDGEVTTFRRDDLPLLKDIVSRHVETIKVWWIEKLYTLNDQFLLACWTSSNSWTNWNVCLPSTKTFTFKFNRMFSKNFRIWINNSFP